MLSDNTWGCPHNLNWIFVGVHNTGFNCMIARISFVHLVIKLPFSAWCKCAEAKIIVAYLNVQILAGWVCNLAV